MKMIAALTIGTHSANSFARLRRGCTPDRELHHHEIGRFGQAWATAASASAATLGHGRLPGILHIVTGPARSKRRAKKPSACATDVEI